EMLSEREKLNLDVQKILDAQTDSWGVKVTNVEIKHIDLNESMVRAIARQAEAERERRAKVIHAEGERQAAQALADASNVLSEHPAALQLRYLQTLTQGAGDKSSTLVCPVPVDRLDRLLPAQRGYTPSDAGRRCRSAWSDWAAWAATWRVVSCREVMSASSTISMPGQRSNGPSTAPHRARACPSSLPRWRRPG